MFSIDKRASFYSLLSLIFLSAGCSKHPADKPIELKENLIVPNIAEERLAYFSEGSFVPDGTVFTMDSVEIATTGFKGKFLVIDFWATWCGPCLEEAPIFKKYARQYEGDNAKFITVSIDSDYTHWKEYITEKEWTGNNYWIGMKEGDPFFSLVYSKHTIGDSTLVLVGLPKYILIDPAGKVISNVNNMRPSNPEFEKLLSSYLK